MQTLVHVFTNHINLCMYVCGSVMCAYMNVFIHTQRERETGEEREREPVAGGGEREIQTDRRQTERKYLTSFGKVFGKVLRKYALTY